MYPFNSSNSISFNDQGRTLKLCLNDDCINPNSRLDDHRSFFCQLPFPYAYCEDDALFLQNDLHDHFLHQKPLTAENTVNIMADAKSKDVDGLMGKTKRKHGHMYGNGKISTRKRSSRKDRHSKINTVNGPRDRRMRLSLDVARSFFGLQDMLGFDKASKTVEWLLENAKSAIKELTRCCPPMKHSSRFGGNSPSSSSGCEVVSGIDESTFNGDQQRRASIISKGKPSTAKEKRIRLRKLTIHSIAKESREKARERARERTREKRRLCESKLRAEPINPELNQLRSWNALETGEESSTQSQNKNPSLEILTEVEELTSRGCEQQLLGTKEDIAGDSLVISGSWSPSTSFSYQHNSGFLHEFTDFQSCGKLWEACNTLNPDI